MSQFKCTLFSRKMDNCTCLVPSVNSAKFLHARWLLPKAEGCCERCLSTPLVVATSFYGSEGTSIIGCFIHHIVLFCHQNTHYLA